MIIKINDEELKKFKLEEIIDKHGIEIIKKSNSRWNLNVSGKDLILSKSSDIFTYLDIENKKTSIRPAYSIIDEENKRITLLLKRRQVKNGSTYQKLPYGGFMTKDYGEKYDLGYDFILAFVINGNFFDDKKYKDLLRYVKANGSLLWKDQIKID